MNDCGNDKKVKRESERRARRTRRSPREQSGVRVSWGLRQSLHLPDSDTPELSPSACVLDRQVGQFNEQYI